MKKKLLLTICPMIFLVFGCATKQTSRTPSASLFTKISCFTTDTKMINDENETLLHIAIKRNNIKDVKKLISCGADVNAKNSSEYTPLHLATSNGSFEIVKALIRAKAELNNETKYNKLRPIHFAVTSSKFRIYDILIQAGAEYSMLDEDGGNLLHRISLFSVDQKGIEDNVDIGKQAKMAEDLIERGLDVNLIEKSYNSTPLHMAASSGKLKVVALFIDHKADLNVRDKGGNTPLEIAKREGHQNIEKLLAQAGASK